MEQATNEREVGIAREFFYGSDTFFLGLCGKGMGTRERGAAVGIWSSFCFKFCLVCGQGFVGRDSIAMVHITQWSLFVLMSCCS